MRNGRFILVYVILTVVQIILANFFGLSRYLLISVLPVLILMLPKDMGAVVSMLVAFATGFAVDFFSTGLLGITPLALVPVALMRRPLAGLVFGDDQAFRKDELTLARMGIIKLTLAVVIACTVFFIIYIWVDSAGTVGFWTAALRILLSVVVSTPVCIFVSGLLRPE